MPTISTIHRDGQLFREVESERYNTTHTFLVTGEMDGEEPNYEYQGEDEPPQYAKETINEFEEEAGRESVYELSDES